MSWKMPDYVDEPLREHLDRVLGLVGKNLPKGEIIEDVFVSKVQTQSGVTNTTAWYFTGRLIGEIRNPNRDDRIVHDLALIKCRVDWMRLDAVRFNFSSENEHPDARLTLEFTTADGLSGELVGAGKSCRHLMDIYKSRFLPNFILEP